MIFKRFILPVTLLLIIIITPAYPQRTKSSQYAGSQRHAEKSLKDSLYFFKFIDASVSNKNNEEEIKIYTEAVRRDMISRTLFLKFSFNTSLLEIKKTQNILIDLFRKIITRDIKEAHEILNENASEILNSKDSSAKKYMALGYRCAISAEKTMLMSDNLNPTNYSIRLYEYVKAIKNAKYAKRYAIIAIIEKRLPHEKKGKTNYNKYAIVSELIDKHLEDKKERYQLIHLDNFYQTKKSIYESITSTPELEKIPEYYDYMKGN